MSRIEDLEKRLSADPNSKIFVQLAEEYRKAGLQEDAIATCREGLEKHPNYFSARVALGRALLETEAFDEACVEFETVLQQVPDNLLALKFLGETLHKLGRIDEAISKYRLASTLSPEDSDLLERIQELEAASAAAHAGHSPAADPSVPPGEQSTPPTIPPAKPGSQFIERQAQEMDPEKVSDDVLSIHENFDVRPVTSFFHRQAREIQDLGSIPPPARKGSPSPASPAESRAPQTPPSAAPAGGKPAPPGQPAPDDAPPPTPPRETATIDLGGAKIKKPLGSAPKPPVPAEAPPHSGQAEQAEPAAESTHDAPGPRPGVPSREEGRPVGETIEENKPGLATTTLAELYVTQGHLDRAVNVYQQLVASKPDNQELRSRLEELELLVSASREPERGRLSGSAGASPRSTESSVRFLEEAIRELEGWLTAIGRS